MIQGLTHAKDILHNHQEQDYFGSLILHSHAVYNLLLILQTLLHDTDLGIHHTPRYFL